MEVVNELILVSENLPYSLSLGKNDKLLKRLLLVRRNKMKNRSTLS